MADKGSAQERRNAQREALRKQREAELKRQRNKSAVIVSLVTIAGLLVVAGVGYLLYQAFKPAEQLALNEPTAITREAPYFELGAPANSGAPVVDIVADFMCPFCGQFETINGQDLKTLADNQEATLRFHIRTFLSSGGSTTQYSSRAAGAAVCTYEESPEIFMTFQGLLWANQPKEGGPGLSDQELIEYAKQAGASQATQSCIKEHTYQRWADEVLEPAGAKTSSATPAVRINGEVWSDGQSLWQIPGAFAEAVRSAGGSGSASDAGGASDSGN